MTHPLFIKFAPDEIDQAEEFLLRHGYQWSNTESRELCIKDGGMALLNQYYGGKRAISPGSYDFPWMDFAVSMEQAEQTLQETYV